MYSNTSKKSICTGDEYDYNDAQSCGNISLLNNMIIMIFKVVVIHAFAQAFPWCKSVSVVTATNQATQEGSRRLQEEGLDIKKNHNAMAKFDAIFGLGFRMSQKMDTIFIVRLQDTNFFFKPFEKEGFNFFI